MMDTETYEQLPVTDAHIGDGVKYLKENMNVNILLHDGKIIGLDMPNHVELEVTDTPPAEKGNTAQGGTNLLLLKQALLLTYLSSSQTVTESELTQELTSTLTECRGICTSI